MGLVFKPQTNAMREVSSIKRCFFDFRNVYDQAEVEGVKGVNYE